MASCLAFQTSEASEAERIDVFASVFSSIGDNRYRVTTSESVLKMRDDNRLRGKEQNL